VRVAVNCAIASRGISGSARGLDLVLQALARIDRVSVDKLRPTVSMRRSRVWNAGAQAVWDLHGAGVEAQLADVLVSPCNVGRAGRSQAHILILHDTMVLDWPELFDRGYANYARAFFGLSVRTADAVIVPSEYTAQCVRRRWPAAGPLVVARWPLKAQRRRIFEGVEFGHVLMVGATEPHKRHAVGLEAVHNARQATGADLRLTLIGPAGRAEDAVARVRKRVDPASQWTARLTAMSDEDLDASYRRAWVLLQPSAAEGYGLPVGEAASRGVPVVHSGFGALSEIAPGGIDGARDASSYSLAIAALLDGGRYTDAAAASAKAAEQLTDARFLAAIRAALAIAVR
jgi:glycosyltransferase involved in cell wall biosynthesis